MKVYLAGPDVFRPDAASVGRAKVAICAEYGLVGLFPLDETLHIEPGRLHLPDGRRASAVISAHCLALLRRCDAVIADLTPFRGPSADVGTAFEHGYAAALGKPVFGYAEGDPGVYATRVAAVAGRCQAHGWLVEDFALFDNLMLAENLAAPLATDFRGCCQQVRRQADAPSTATAPPPRRS